jgi:hypothetical protein
MNKQEPSRFAELTPDKLIEIALANDCDEDTYNEILWKLCLTTTADVFEKAQQLCLDNDSARRELGVLILGQFGIDTPVREMQVVKTFLELLERENNPEVLASIGWGLSHRRAAEGVVPLSKLKCHPDSEVRLGVAAGLQCQTSELAIETLIELSQDESIDVRSWATFALGTQIGEDNRAIREALYARLADTDFETRREAVHGLAKRKDQRAAVPLLEFLTRSQLIFQDIEAARSLANPELHEALVSLKGCGEVSDPEIDTAIDRCNKDLETFKQTVSYDGYRPSINFEFFTELLGKPANDEAIAQLIEKLDEMPRNYFANTEAEGNYFSDNVGLWQIYFAESGLCVGIEKGRFNIVVFYVDHKIRSTSGMRTYTGTFPYGITRHDSLDAISKKLGVETHPNGIFELPEFYLKFDFDDASGNMDAFYVSAPLPKHNSQLCFNEIISVLGCAVSESNFQNLISQLNETPKVTKLKHTTFYDLNEHGLEYIVTAERIDHVMFMINTSSTRDGWIKPYSLDFPIGIKPEYDKSQVVAKLDAADINCVSCKGDSAVYRFPGFQLSFLFESESSDSLISSVEVHLRPESSAD